MNNILPFKNNKLFAVKSALAGIILSFLLLTLFVSPALAVDSGTISANPTKFSDNDPRTRSWFIYSYSAGEIRNDSVTVENKGTEAITVKVYPVDSTTTSDGGFALANENTPRKGIGAWVKINTDAVTLAPNEKRVIPFTISIPANAQKGEYSGGIVFENTTPKNIKNKKVNINIISRVGVRIYETVPGPEQLNMEISGLNYSIVDNYLNFTFNLKNKGTISVSPTGTLQIKDMFGRIINTTPLEKLLDITNPGQSITINVPTNMLSPLFGWNTADVAVYYSPTKAAVANLIFIPNPSITYATIFVILLLIALLVIKKYRAHKKPKHTK